MLILKRLRSLLLVLAWPAALLFTARQWPALFEQRPDALEIAALSLAVIGGLIAAGFSRWRLTHGFLLVVLASATARLPELSAAMTLLPILALGLLPWLREGGMTGAPSLLSGTLLLLLAALWLRGGSPAALIDGALTLELSWRELTITTGMALAALLLTAALVRVMVLDVAVEGALTGAMAAMMLLIPEGIPAAIRLAASAGAVLALWTGLLLHAWRMAYLDQLTGLPNRRALEDALKALPARWSLSMLDVDHFKKFNDTWGHDVGDQVLRRVASALQSVGARGKAYRYGGEEFSVLFPHDDLERAATAVEAVREQIAATPFQVRGKRKGAKQRGKQKGRGEQRITISAGLATAGADPAARVFKRADQALYKAKKQGRNRLVRAN